jgi:hypothetical protein
MAQPVAEASSGVTAVPDFDSRDIAEGFVLGDEPGWQLL